MRIIKRYSNRRLYDTTSSRTLTQRQLAELIRSGEDIQVIDNVSGRDITAEVLGRIVLAESAFWSDTWNSKDLFTRLIELGGESMSILKNTVLASIGAFEVTMAKAEEIIDELIKKGELNKSDRTQAVMELVEKAENSTSKVYNRVAQEVSKASEEVSKVSDQIMKYKVVKREDIQSLEGKVDELTKVVKKLQKQLAEKDKPAKEE